ncbi:MAG TPA: T9SS type A sorting domain-containing protein [Bacteroidota bacterium]|nr:T9SS type A sorting domain-containing protein [Bacteroidota bacterium]
MKAFLYTFLACALLLCLGAITGPVHAQVLVTFDNPSDLSGDFNSTNNYYGCGGTAGIGGSGAVQNPFEGYNYGSDIDLWTLKSGVPAVGGVFTVSAYFYNNTDGGYGGLGFATSNTNAPVGFGETATGLGMLTHAGGGMFAVNGVESSLDYGIDQLLEGHWYKITFTVTEVDPGVYDLEYTIVNSDADGNTGSTVTDQVAHNVSNAAFGSAPVLYPYFSGDASRMLLIDNFSAPQAAPLPIQLASLTAAPAGGSSVTLNWKTASETNNYGFYVERSANKSTGFAAVSGLIPGHGTTTTGFSYTYTDKSAPAGTAYYRLEQIDLDNSVHYSDAVMLTTTAAAETAPIVFALSQNYPNPFNPSTEFRFTVAKTGSTTLVVYNALGQEVATIFNGQTESGKFYSARLDGTGLASGIYFARLQSGSEIQMRKIVLMK